VHYLSAAPGTLTGSGLEGRGFVLRAPTGHQIYLLPAVGPIRPTTQMERSKFPGMKRRSYNFTPPHLFVMAQEELRSTLQADNNACLFYDADTTDLVRILIF